MRSPYRLRLALLSLLLLPACDKSPAPTESNTTTQQGISALESSTAAAQPFEVAQAFFELNSTFHDMGFQVFLDAPGWKHVSLTDPDGNTVFGLHTEGGLSELGITELHFESEEPAPAELKPKFPPGRYTFRGQTAAGEPMLSQVSVNQRMPDPPTVSPRDGQLVDKSNTVVRWTAPGADQVEVIIEQDELGHSLDVLVSGSTTRLTVPPQFLRTGREYKIEVQSIAENKNRTIVESTFRTR
ncbi:MAG TPA: hypothetical protein VIM84_10995 [Gemmatimonadales bacterium]